MDGITHFLFKEYLMESLVLGYSAQKRNLWVLFTTWVKTHLPSQQGSSEVKATSLLLFARFKLVERNTLKK